MATRDIPEGEELTTRYKAGTLHRPDASLFLYGFLPEASPRWKECGRVHAASWLMADTRLRSLLAHSPSLRSYRKGHAMNGAGTVLAGAGERGAAAVCCGPAVVQLLEPLAADTAGGPAG